MLKKIFRRLLAIILIPIIAVVLILGYLGFIPVVSGWFGSDKPQDLGAAWSEIDRASANEKYGQEFVDIESGQNPNTILRASRANSIDAVFTGKEIAAHVEETHPVKDVQVVFHADGSFEASGRIDKSRIVNFLRATGVERVDEAGVLATIDRYLPGNPVFYMKGRGSVTNDQAKLDLDQAKIGRLPLSTSAFAEGLVAYAETIMANVPHFDPESVSITDGQLRYLGTAPAIVPVY